MNRAISTKEKLLQVARGLFWTRGYSNVSVRDITKEVGCDASLVSRYFGGKEGLFDATLDTLPSWDVLSAPRDDIVAMTVAMFTRSFDTEAHRVSPFNMFLTNVTDPVTAPKVRKILQTDIADVLARQIGGVRAAEQTAMLLSLVFGFSLMRKNFQLEALASAAPEKLQDLLAPLVAQALRTEE